MGMDIKSVFVCIGNHQIILQNGHLFYIPIEREFEFQLHLYRIFGAVLVSDLRHFKKGYRTSQFWLYSPLPNNTRQ